MSRSALSSVSLLVITLTLALTLGLTAAQQQPTTPASTRDPQALAILQQAIIAAGGPQSLSAINDFSAIGLITYTGAPHQPSGQVKVQGRGIDQVRMDVQVPGGTRSLVLNHGAGSFKDLASTTKISSVNGFQLGLLVFPVPALISALADPLADIVLEGTVESNGASVYKIKIARSAPVGFQSAVDIKSLRTSEILINSTSYMVVGLSHQYYPRTSSAYLLTREVFFGDFKLVGGVMFPFSVTEKMGGQPSWEITLTSVDFNSGLTDGLFQQ